MSQMKWREKPLQRREKNPKNQPGSDQQDKDKTQNEDNKVTSSIVSVAIMDV